LAGLAGVFLFVAACADDGEEFSTDTPTESVSSNDSTSSSTASGNQNGVDVLGNATHSLDAVVVEVLATANMGLSQPTDVEIHPTRNSEAWITNRGDNSIVVVEGILASSISATRFSGPGAQHFLPRPTALSFGANGYFATIHEEDRPTQGDATPWDFMGPTLWLSEPGMFKADQSTHYDMLHNSPNAMGIAWEVANVYWVYDGLHLSLTRYDFAADHGPGQHDHTDGSLRRYVEGQLSYVPGVVAHLAYDHEAAKLYVADPGHARIAVLDTQSGHAGGLIEPNYDNKDKPNAQVQWLDANLTTLVDGRSLAIAMTQPAGLEIADDLIFVSDHASSTIFAFSKSGEVIDWLPTGRPAGSLQGMAFDPNGNLYVIDGLAQELLRISPKVRTR
jgi:hypothetical protein